MKNRRVLIAGCAGLLAVCLCLSVIGGAVFAYYQLLPGTPARVEAPVELSGHMVIGFEVASFVPCGAEESGEAYWLSADPDIELYNSYHAVADDYTPAFLHFTGRLSPPGEYGHLGGYTREVTVTEIIELSATGVCPAP